MSFHRGNWFQVHVGHSRPLAQLEQRPHVALAQMSAQEIAGHDPGQNLPGVGCEDMAIHQSTSLTKLNRISRARTASTVKTTSTSVIVASCWFVAASEEAGTENEATAFGLPCPGRGLSRRP